MPRRYICRRVWSYPTPIHNSTVTTKLVFTGALLAACVLAVGCPQSIHVGLREPARVENLTFVIGDQRTRTEDLRSIDGLAVNTCTSAGHERRWSAFRPSGVERQVLNTIPYGEAPPGWQTTLGPLLLNPGCYSFSVSGEPGLAGSFVFEVDSSGNARSR